MTGRLSGYVTSFFIHFLIIGTAFWLSNSVPLRGKPLTIDFRIDSITAKVVEQPKPPQKKVVKKIIPKPKKIVSKPPPEKPKKIIPKPAPVVSTKPIPIEEPEPIVEEVFEEVEEVIASEEETKETEIIQEISPEEFQRQLRSQFLKAHFQYIREDIQNNVIYPTIARKMGWQGKVVIKFIVCEDGRVINVEIIESSGYSVLDKNAIKSVQSAAPFPRPPVRTELIIPIRFGLV